VTQPATTGSEMASYTVGRPTIVAAYAISECEPLSSQSLRSSCGVMSSTKLAPASSHAGASGLEVARDDPLGEGLGGDRRRVLDAGVAGDGLQGLVGDRRGDPVDHRGGEADVLGSTHAASDGSTSTATLADHVGDHLAVVGDVVARAEGDRAGAGLAAGDQAGGELAGGRLDVGEVPGLDGLDVGGDGRVVGVDAPPGLGRYPASVMVEVTIASSGLRKYSSNCATSVPECVAESELITW
jgi:hypothetical protein